MRVPKWRGVGNHDAGIAVPPERPLIRPTDARNERWKRGTFRGDPRMFPEESDGAAQQCVGMNIANKSDKVANLWIKKAEPRRRIGL